MIFETFLIIPWLVNFNHPDVAGVTLDFDCVARRRHVKARWRLRTRGKVENKADVAGRFPAGHRCDAMARSRVFAN